MSSVLVRLYPARWRDRYGDEFEALLDERPLGPFDVADIILGALDAQLRLRGRGSDIRQERRLSMSVRIGGLAAAIGAALLAGAGLMTYVEQIDGAIQPLLLFTGLSALLVAMAGLSAFQARVAPRLIWSAFLLTAAGTIAAVAGFVGPFLLGEGNGDALWTIWFVGLVAALAGSALFATATYRTATLSRGAAVLIIVGSVLPFLGFFLPFVSGTDQPLILASIVCFLTGWFVLGVQAIRLDRPGVATRPA
jgi:hypothetical protein